MQLFRNRTRIAWLAVALMLVAVVLLIVSQWERSHSDFKSESEWKLAEFVEHGGTLYRLRDDVDTLLIVGVDKFSGTQAEDSYNNDQCADFLLLLVIDHATEQCSVVHINRDTVAEINVLGIGGKKVGTVSEQISLSHTYGTGGQDSCRNTARAVSGLLGGVGVDHYACLTMDAVGVLNDLVGGVTLTVEQDLTAIDPAFVKGQSITLSAEQALRFVRHRSELADSSNASRMERQQQYLSALYPLVLGYVEKNDDFPAEVVSSLSNYTTTDFSVSELERTVDTLAAYEKGEIFSLEGSYSVGEHVEFYAEEQYMKDLVIRLFYEPQ